jgi:hypothetical protein
MAKKVYKPEEIVNLLRHVERRTKCDLIQPFVFSSSLLRISVCSDSDHSEISQWSLERHSAFRERYMGPTQHGL